MSLSIMMKNNMLQNKKNMMKMKRRKAAKSLKIKKGNDDYPNFLFINMNIHIAWSSETGHAVDLAK